MDFGIQVDNIVKVMETMANDVCKQNVNLGHSAKEYTYYFSPLDNSSLDISAPNIPPTAN